MMCLSGCSIIRYFQMCVVLVIVFFFFQAEDGIRDIGVTGVQTCALPIFLTATPALGTYSIVSKTPSSPRGPRNLLHSKDASASSSIVHITCRPERRIA